MNLRTQHTRSQRTQLMEDLVERVVNAVVNPQPKKVPRRKKLGGRAAPRKKGRSALSQSQRSAPTSSPPHDVISSSLVAPNLVEKERVEEQVEERNKSASTTESPPATQNLPPLSTQPLPALGILDALGEYFDREEEELGGPVEEEGPVVDDNDDEDRPRQVQS